jgi:membrane-bound inhibitor of C-type lysozyme
MNKLVLAFLSLVILAAGGWFFYSSNQTAKAPVFVAVSFVCADNSHFVAEFPTEQMITVNIVVDGTQVRSLPKATGAGQRFEDSAYTYVFAGEEATVTHKATNVSTTCSQPQDESNAPFNFGDAGEGAGSIQPDTALVVSEGIVGKWQSTEDAKFVREFKVGNIVVDSHDNKALATSTFAVFTKATAPTSTIPFEESAVYVQIKEGAEFFTFKVAKLTPEELELIYMERGGTLTYKAIQ